MTFNQLKPYLEKQAALLHAQAILSFDRNTLRLKKASGSTALTLRELNRELLALKQDPELKTILLECRQDSSLPLTEKRIVEEWLKTIEKEEKIPTEETLKYRQVVMKCAEVWPQYKQNKDWNGFMPYLQEVISQRKKMAQLLQKEGQSLYDVLLDEYLPGFNTETLDHFFDQLKDKIVPLLQKIQEKDNFDDHFMHQYFDPKDQESYVRNLIERLGFDFEAGDIFESEHPFTTHFNCFDVRFTNKYNTHDLHSIFSAIHETGHALYEMGIAEDISRTPIGSGTSTPMHEGQSRFYENMIGRNPLFWENEFENLKQVFPKQFENVSLVDFLKACNKVEANLIRIKADELTYSLHIILRYELEKEIINKDIDIRLLPTMWNAKVKEFLGLDVFSDTEGILQDMHWGSGLIGYFPGYSLGSAIAAQLFDTMKKEYGIENLIRNQDYAAIREILRNHIHQYGKIYTTDELLMQFCKEPFNPQYYIDYLMEKFSQLYTI